MKLLMIFLGLVLLTSGMKGEDEDEYFVIQQRPPSLLSYDDYQTSTETPIVRDQVVVTKVRLHGGKTMERGPIFAKVFESFRQPSGGSIIPKKVFRELFIKTWASHLRRDTEEHSKKPVDNHYLRARRNNIGVQGVGFKGGRVVKESRDSSRNHFLRANRSNQSIVNVGDRKARNHYLRSV